MISRLPAWLRDVLGFAAAVLWGLSLLGVAAPAGPGCPVPLADALGDQSCADSVGRVGWAAVWLVLALATSFAYVVALLRRDER